MFNFERKSIKEEKIKVHDDPLVVGTSANGSFGIDENLVAVDIQEQWKEEYQKEDEQKQKNTVDNISANNIIDNYKEKEEDSLEYLYGKIIEESEQKPSPKGEGLVNGLEEGGYLKRYKESDTGNIVKNTNKIPNLKMLGISKKIKDFYGISEKNQKIHALMYLNQEAKDFQKIARAIDHLNHGKKEKEILIIFNKISFLYFMLVCKI